MYKFLIILVLFVIKSSYQYQLNYQGGIQYAKQKESPWFVLLMWNDTRCGGSLIRDKYVITAAHCFDRMSLKYKDLNSTKIILGEWKTNMNPDCSNQEESVEDEDEEVCDLSTAIKFKDVRIHEGYNSRDGSNFENDIAIIKLAWEPKTSVLISNIELPNKYDCEKGFSNDKIIVTGFGFKDSMNNYATTKKKYELNPISNNECKDLLNRSDSKNIKIPPKHVCAKNTRGYPTCKGDSGSGAVAWNRGIPYLQGIVSFGTSKCESKIFPTGFTKVGCYIDWINQQINDMEGSIATHQKSQEASEETDCFKENDDDTCL